MEDKKQEVKEQKKNKKTEVEQEEKYDKELEEVKEIIIEKKVGFNTLEVIIIMFITLCFGGLLGSALSYAFNNKNTVEITSMPSELKEFVNTYNDIKENYYEELDDKKLLDAGIEGMLNFLGDKYSVYMDQDETISFNEQVEGKYVGIGCELMQSDDKIIISKIFGNSPSEKAGLKIGDTIIKVDEEDVIDQSVSEISSKVKGLEGTKVKITILRDKEEIELILTRESVDIPSVESKIYNVNQKKIGYILIDIFASNTYSQFKEQLEELEKEKIDSLIIDVRDNSGGYLTTVKDIASLFLGKNKIIYQLETKGINEKIYSETNEERNYPIAVIINEYSASASEILAGAIKESYKGIVVGVNSYGKGTVQKAYQLKSGATVKYTIQKWLTPNGNWINEKGITPDNYVEQSKDYLLTGDEKYDTQLQETLTIMGEK